MDEIKARFIFNNQPRQFEGTTLAVPNGQTIDCRLPVAPSIYT